MSTLPAFSGDFERRLVTAMPRLKRLAYALTASTADSEDLVQSTVERALARQEQCIDKSKVESWAFSILRSIWKNELRSRYVRRGHGLENVEDLIDPNMPEKQYELGLLRKAVQELPEHYREVVMLVDVCGMSYQEATDMLALQKGTVMSRVSRGRKMLLDTLGTKNVAEVQKQ